MDIFKLYKLNIIKELMPFMIYVCHDNSDKLKLRFFKLATILVNYY